MLLLAYYVQNYAGIIGASLQENLQLALPNRLQLGLIVPLPLPGPGSVPGQVIHAHLQLWLLQSTKFSKSISLLQYLNLKKKVKQPLPNPSSTLSLRSHLPGFQQILALQNS